MRDVAERAGVSFKTVSRVVRNEAGVSPELAARVSDAVDALGYRPDDRARNLRQGATTTGAIGFVLVDIANPFFASILRGIEDVARDRGYLVLAGSNDGLEARGAQLIEAFIARRVDGLIVVPPGHDLGALRTEISRGTPVVLLDQDVDDADVDLVRSDHLGGAKAATHHLINSGHRRIAFYGDDCSLFSAGLRREGFLDAMREAEINVDASLVVTGRQSADDWRGTIADSLQRGEQRPTAIVTAQNFITVGGVQALHDLGLQHTIAQVGFDDVELADVVDPPLTVVPQDPRQLGRIAAERLFQRIDGHRVDSVHEVLPLAVMARGSGEIRPPASGRVH